MGLPKRYWLAAVIFFACALIVLFGPELQQFAFLVGVWFGGSGIVVLEGLDRCRRRG